MNNGITTKERSLFGFWLYILSDCVLFAGLFAVFAVLRGNTYGGPTGEDLLNLPYLFAQTVILLASSYAMGLALVGARRKKTPVVLAGLALALLLGLSFLGLEASEFARLVAAGSGPGRSAFLSAFFTLVGTHGLHVLLGSLWMLLIGIYIWVRGLSPNLERKLRMLGMFWHFLDIVWIFIFSVVYLLSTAL